MMTFDFNMFYSEIILDKIISSAIIFFLGFMFGKIAFNLSKRLFFEIDLNDRVSNSFLNKINIEKILSKTIEYTIYFITVILTLQKLGIVSVLLKSLIILIVAIIIITIIMDLTDLIPNIIAYVKIKKNKYFKVGDRIKIHLANGIVKEITPIRVKIITDHNDEINIRNNAILENFIIKRN